MSGTGSNEKKELMVVTTQSSDEEKSFHRENKNGKLQNHPLQDFMWKGVMCFLVIVASVLCAFIIVHISDVMKAFHALMNILQPILVGLVFAYLLNPIMKWFEKIFFKISKKSPEDKKAKKRIRSISLILSIVFAVVIITVIIYAVLPDLLISITNLVRDMPGHVNTFAKWIGSLSINEKYDDLIQDAVISAEKYIENWIKTDLLGKMDTFFSRITVGVVGVINVLENVFIGLIVSIYVLSTKEKFKGQTKKLLYAVFPKKTTENILELARDSDRIFLGFLSGKIIDSCIIGVLCFIILSILNMPYTLIVSVIVGVTNIIPFFGPYIGGVPSAILIFLANPKSGIIFIIVIVILQQLDGNFIGPKILGNSTGLSAFWVIFAIMLGSGLFGFLGMIFGVPTFGVIYHIIKKSVNQNLKKKHLPTDTAAYADSGMIETVEERKNTVEKAGEK